MDYTTGGFFEYPTAPAYFFNHAPSFCIGGEMQHVSIGLNEVGINKATIVAVGKLNNFITVITADSRTKKFRVHLVYGGRAVVSHSLPIGWNNYRVSAATFGASVLDEVERCIVDFTFEVERNVVKAD
jgi:hypothetical protein